MTRRLALISVSDKTGLKEFAVKLVSLGFEILTTGGTAKFLKDAGIPVTAVEDFTGSPEILDGRVKTLHPLIHGGILMDRDQATHIADAKKVGVRPIDLVIANLYPFASEVLAKGEKNTAAAIEYIDIGGPTLLRAAAKNHRHCLAIIDPNDYPHVIDALTAGEVPLALRQQLAAKTFAAISAYDGMIATYLTTGDDGLPPSFNITLERYQELRYGENPTQQAALYRNGSEAGILAAQVLQGKELSYNNWLDLDAAARLVTDFTMPALAIIKHTNPCGVAAGGSSAAELFDRALASDSLSAFGGIVATNVAIDGATAKKLSDIFLECIIAPEITPEAKNIFLQKKNLRVLGLPLLAQPSTANKPIEWRSIWGGMLAQSSCEKVPVPANWQVVSERTPSADEKAELHFAMTVAKHVKSNAIVFTKDLTTIAIGAGQMSRIDAAQIACDKAKRLGHDLKGSCLASDAFFPFADTVQLAAEIGVRAIIQPGGSIRDQDSIAAANEHGIAMVFCGQRFFKH